MGCFDYKDGYFYFPKGEGRRKKLNQLKNSGAYRYPNGVATSIANTKLKDLQSFAAILQKETAKKYYLCLQGLLSAVKDGVTAKGMENYLAFHLGTACDEKLLNTLLRIFSKISDTGGKLYRLESNAFTLYLQRKRFREQKQSGAETCPYPLTQIYRICYPEITGQLQTQFQTLEMTPDAADTFVQGMEKLRHCCSERIGTEYLRQLVREQFFAGDQQVIRLLLSRLDMALQKQKTEAAAASVALRSMTFAAAKGEESYTSFSREDCRAYLLKNREPADESHLAK